MRPDRSLPRDRARAPLPARPGGSGRAVIAGIILICTAIEAGLFLSDVGLLDPPGLRWRLFTYAAFWPGLVSDWSAHYTLQPYAMFLSYGFLHGGPLHLAMNMVTLSSLAAPAMARIGVWRFLAIYFGAMVGGGAVYAILALGGPPMVGASGALFGVAGALLGWTWGDQPTLGDAVRIAGRGVLLLVVLNILLFFVFRGQLAWQTHLGGFLAGWIIAVALDPLPPARGGPGAAQARAARRRGADPGDEE